MLEKIKVLCEERKISIAQLERETSLGNGVIGRWGESSPRVDNLKKVADYFGVTMDDLVNSCSSL